MATLAVTIQTKLAAVVASTHLIDLSRQRDTVNTDEDTARTLAVAEMAAADVEGYLGDNLTDADTQAVSLGTRLALIQYASVYTLKLTDAGVIYIGEARRELERLADRRSREEADPVQTDLDYTDLDKRFPATEWET